MSRNDLPRLTVSYSEAMKAQDDELIEMMSEIKEKGVSVNQLLDLIDMTIRTDDIQQSIRDFYNDNYRST